MKITEDVKVFHLLEEYPELEEVIKKHFTYFYENNLVDIALKRLSIKGAFNVLDFNEKQKEEFFEDLNSKLKEIEENY